MSDVLQPFSHLERQSFEAGKILMAQGQTDHKLLILISGAVEVLKDDVRVARSREPGSVFGEISLLLQVSHTATVRTTEASSFFVLENPEEFLKSNPDAALNLCRILARRIDGLNRYMVDLKRQYQDDGLGMIDQCLDTLMHHQPRAWSPPSLASAPEPGLHHA